MIRSSYLGLDETLCAIQGYAGACVINAVRGINSVSPTNGAICLGGIALLEKLTYQISRRIIPGPTALLGPIPIGTKNIVSHGLAIYTTFKLMALAGLILDVPCAVTVIGVACAVSCAAGLAFIGIKSLTQKMLKSFDERLQDHLNFSSFANAVFQFKEEKRVYNIRVICNPEKKEVVFRPGSQGTLCCSDPYILACNENIPNELLTRYFADRTFSVFSVKINDANPLDYTANPTLVNSSL